MLVILKIPVAYLGTVVWYAVRAVPRPPEGAIVPAALRPDSAVARHAPPRRPGRPRGGPHGSPSRTSMRPRRAALAAASGSVVRRPR